MVQGEGTSQLPRHQAGARSLGWELAADAVPDEL